MHLLLLRSPASPLSSDAYHSHLAPSIQPDLRTLHHLPVLSTTFLDAPTLQDLISLGPRDLYSALILTSSRAVEAWSLSVLSDAASHQDWYSIPIFVVGPSTRDAVLSDLFPGHERVLGALEGEAGSGAKLGKFVVEWFRKEKKGKGEEELPILYLVGDKNRDTIPRLLEEEGIGLVKVQVYKTSPMDEFERRLTDTLREIEGHEGEKERRSVWIVLFSPSGAQHAVQVLRKMDLLPPTSTTTTAAPTTTAGVASTRTKIKLAAIGPTTKDCIVQDEGLSCLAVAESPTPEGLWKALVEAENGGEAANGAGR